MTEPKTQFEADMISLTPDQFKQAEQALESARKVRSGAADNAVFRKKLSLMTDQEFERHKREIYD